MCECIYSINKHFCLNLELFSILLHTHTHTHTHTHINIFICEYKKKKYWFYARIYLLYLTFIPWRILEILIKKNKKKYLKKRNHRKKRDESNFTRRFFFFQPFPFEKIEIAEALKWLLLCYFLLSFYRPSISYIWWWSPFLA